jgi:hypothetical protein
VFFVLFVNEMIFLSLTVFGGLCVLAWAFTQLADLQYCNPKAIAKKLTANRFRVISVAYTYSARAHMRARVLACFFV